MASFSLIAPPSATEAMQLHEATAIPDTDHPLAQPVFIPVDMPDGVPHTIQLGGATIACDWWRFASRVSEVEELQLYQRIPLCPAPDWRETSGCTRLNDSLFAPRLGRRTPKWCTETVLNTLRQTIDAGLPWYMSKILWCGVPDYMHEPFTGGVPNSHAPHAFLLGVLRTPIVNAQALANVFRAGETDYISEVHTAIKLAGEVLADAECLCTDSTWRHNNWAYERGIGKLRSVSHIPAALSAQAIKSVKMAYTTVSLRTCLFTVPLSFACLEVAPYIRRVKKRATARKVSPQTERKPPERFAVDPLILARVGRAAGKIFSEHTKIADLVGVPSVTYYYDSKYWDYASQMLRRVLRFMRVFNLYDELRKTDEFQELLKLWREATPRRRKWIAGHSPDQARWLAYEAQRKAPGKRVRVAKFRADQLCTTDGYFVPEAVAGEAEQSTLAASASVPKAPMDLVPDFS